MTKAAIERRALPGVLARGRVLYGHAALFAQETRIEDFLEIIAPGAFAKSLATGRDIVALLDHRADALLGRTRTGTLKLSEDTRGLAFELTLPDTQAGRDVAALAERGDLGGMSFGFVATDEAWDGKRRELRGIALHEISVVQAWPAYADTTVAMRSMPNVREGDSLALHRLWFATL